MPRPDPKAPTTGQESLFDAVESTATARAGQVLRGRHSQAMDRAIDAARTAEVVGPMDEGLTTVLRAGAWALDSMERSGHHYGPSKLIPGITEALRDAHMTPESRQTDTDAAIVELLNDLAKADTDDDAALHHAED
ncbi:hypothetical protein GMA5_1 [Gordonia phage GMA5]|uniref:Uncharacterized protein n=1 Tax=Gordonia phage GMA5 TaxID=1647472 RepID=A0A0K0MWV9_9CAUD|nr:terminase small subunit [Gordonia phage GMA5]AKI28615.1 hypothetical protein GMA5_1 [Gordonia phage GMA5]